MDFFKPFLSSSENQSFGNLGSSNDGLTIEVTKSNIQGSLSIENKKQAINLFAIPFQNKKAMQFSQTAVSQLQRSSQQIEFSTIPSSFSRTSPISQQQLPSLFSPLQKTRPFSTPVLPQVSGQSSTLSQQPTTRIEVIKKSNYWQILEQCRRTNTPFTDPDFPPEDKSLGVQSYVQKQKGYGGWERISKIVENPVFVKKFDISDAIQGSLGNCYFVSSIASLAKDYPNMFDKIFVSNKMNEYGVYMARFYVQGVLVQVVVDDYVPVSTDKKAYYAYPSKDNEVWAMILEKCWAKLFKTYERIDGGQPQEVFYALTGAPFGIKPLNMPQEIKLRQFIKLFKYQQKGSLFSCFTKRVNKQDIVKDLAPGHAYAVLQIHINPICIIKLRNPKGVNKAGYYYDWKTNLAKQFGKQKAQIYLNLLAKKQIDLFAPQTEGIFYMYYSEFMSHFESITVCHIRNDFNLLSLRSTFTKNKGKFFYFELVKETPLVVSMSQMFKKMQVKYETEEAYAVTTLVLAKVVKGKRANLEMKNKISLNESSSDDASLRVSMTHRESLNQSSKSSRSQSDISEDQSIGYEFIAARSNSNLSPFNFLMMNQNNAGQFQEKIFYPGRYVIYASANISRMLMKKDCTITVHSLDSSFPKQLTNFSDLFALKTSGLTSILGNLGIVDQNQKFQTKWLQQVFLDKVLSDRSNIKPLNEYVKLNQTNSPFNQELDKILNAQMSLQDSWYSCRIPSLQLNEKMGGFGYFACHLSEKHETMESFEFKINEYYGRFLEFITADETFTSKQDTTYVLSIKPGETKIIVMKAITYKTDEMASVTLKYKIAGDPIGTVAPMPNRVSNKVYMEKKIGTMESLVSAISFPSFSK